MQSAVTATHPVGVRYAISPLKSNSEGTYGDRMAVRMGLKEAVAVTARTRRNAQLAVTRLFSERGLSEKTTPLPVERAFGIHLHLRPTSPVRLWYHGRPVMVDPNRQEGSVSIIDMGQEPSGYLGSAFDMVQIYLSRAALDEFADENGGRRCDTLTWPFGKVDPTLHSLGRSILPAMEQPEFNYDLYTDHVIFALQAYIARTYGGITAGRTVTRGGLAQWQKTRAVEMLRANMDGQISLTQVAHECRLSVSHFVRAFKQTLGQPPYRWLMEQRIEAAKDLLLRSHLPLAEIALRCGFADQACLIRAFRRTTGSTPGEWRRTRAMAPSNYFCCNGSEPKIYA